ncbi:hypothetical protein [Sagittula stellata]|uniref:hypothetical protein n=1 Tax=Sagittula stellata TaxID=52603 RepID=UPI0018DC8DD8|nr:hypothetical protein [Sagittula stellata]
MSRYRREPETEKRFAVKNCVTDCKKLCHATATVAAIFGVVLQKAVRGAPPKFYQLIKFSDVAL